MTYQRVIPRDLFNEAKLLKCIGMLALHELEKGLPDGVQLDNHGDAFNIIQDECSGDITCQNVRLEVKGRRLFLWTPMNSREPHPLYIVVNHEEIEVFEEGGSVSSEFINAISTYTE